MDRQVRRWTWDLPGLNGEWEFPSWPGSVLQGGSGLPSGEGQNLGRGKHVPLGPWPLAKPWLCRPQSLVFWARWQVTGGLKSEDHSCSKNQG